MGADFERIEFIGNLGKDPRMQYTTAGKAVTHFSVATNRVYTGADGQEVKETTWHDVTVWGKSAEACNQYLHKGSLVFVEGRLVPDPKTGGPKLRQDEQTGIWHASFDVNATTVKFLDRRNGAPEAVTGEGGDESIPF